jgi:hypothetical protein
VTQYFERPFSHRLGALGDKAEGVFQGLHPNAHSLGLRRPALNVGRMPAVLRYTPDFMLEDRAVEVMGFSSKGSATLKLKLEKADALRAWDLLMPTFLWVYDSGKQRYWTARVSDWLDSCHSHAERAFFADNKRPYWNLGIEYFPSSPVSVIAA